MHIMLHACVSITVCISIAVNFFLPPSLTLSLHPVSIDYRKHALSTLQYLKFVGPGS